MNRNIWLKITISILLPSLISCQPNPATETPYPITEIPTTIEATESPRETTEPEKHSVVLISFDGSRADFVYGMMEDGTLPAFASVAEMGVRAGYAQTIDPSLTAAAHNSISSGSFPSQTGITSNSFHVTGDDFYWYRVGYDETMDEAEPVWVTASNNGLTTAVVFFVGGSPSHIGQLADYTIGYGVEDAYSKQLNVRLSAADGWSHVPESYSPPLAGDFSIQDVRKVYLYVLDSTDDSTENYDTVILNIEPSGADPAKVLQQKQWGSMVLLERLHAGADFLIQEITSESVKLYHTGVEHNNAAPKELLDSLNKNFGPFPAGADSYAIEHGWITAEDDLYLLLRQSTYMAEVAAWVYSTYQPDLMLTWQDPFDSAGHQFLLTDPRQLNYSPELAETYDGYYRQAASIADSSLQTMLDTFDLNNTTVMLVGDHGMAPLHTRVYVNTILEDAGLLTLDSQNYVVLKETKAFAVCSGGAVHVYINLEGREKGGGTVPESEYANVQDQIVDLLKNLTDPNTNEPVFQRVLTRNELGPLGLDHPNSGDVFAQTYPGYHLDGWRGNDFVFKPADFYGQHGYDSTLPEMHTIFIAAGVDVSQKGEVISPVRVVDYAPTIASFLNYDPASTVQGSPILELMQP